MTLCKPNSPTQSLFHICTFFFFLSQENKNGTNENNSCSGGHTWSFAWNNITGTREKKMEKIPVQFQGKIRFSTCMCVTSCPTPCAWMNWAKWALVSSVISISWTDPFSSWFTTWNTSKGHQYSTNTPYQLKSKERILPFNNMHIVHKNRRCRILSVSLDFMNSSWDMKRLTYSFNLSPVCSDMLFWRLLAFETPYIERYLKSLY